MNKIIIYEKLNIFTLFHSLLTKFCYKQHYFLGYSRFIKSYCSSIVNKISILQIHFVNFQASVSYAEGSKMAIEFGQKIVNDNHKLAAPFVKYLKDQRAINLTKNIYINSLIKHCAKYTVLKEFIRRNKGHDIYYFPTEKNLIKDFLESETHSVTIIRWHLPLLSFIAFIRGLANYILLAVVPFLISARMIKQGRISFRSVYMKKLSKKIVFFHNSPFVNSVNQSIYRDFYFFHSSILKISDCIHSGMYRPLSPEKSAYLKDRGGLVYDYMSEKVPSKFIVDCLFVDYYRCFFRLFFPLAFNRFTSLSTIMYVLGVIGRITELKYLLSRIDTKLAIFETEMGFLCSIYTILADKNAIKTITMAHGYGYCIPDCTRAFMVVNYYLVQGSYYKKYLLPDNPAIDNYCLIGDIEIETIGSNKAKLLQNLYIRKDKKIVAVFLRFNFFVPGENDGIQKIYGSVFTEEDTRRSLEILWKPFLEWANSQDDLFFIFKGKPFQKQYEHPFMKKLMASLSKEKYCQNDNLHIKDLIAISDCIIGNSVSSTLFSTLLLGKPAISYNFNTPRYALEYDKHLVATDADELISNLTHILKHGISKDVFETARRDHYAEGNLDFKAAERIKKLTKKIISN